MTAIDLSAGMIQTARARHPQLGFCQMDATTLAFAASEFDAALFSYNGIDYIYPAADRARCLAEVCRVLRPGGVLIFSTHNVIGALFSGGYFYPPATSTPFGSWPLNCGMDWRASGTSNTAMNGSGSTALRSRA